MDSQDGRTNTAPRESRALLLGVFGGLALRLALIGSGWCDGNVIADDAYYYFTIARHILAGAGPTFDGLAATNGFHPLYQFLLVPVFGIARLLGSDPMRPVHAALCVCALFDAATAWLLARILDRLGSRTGGMIAAWLWSLSPVSVLLTLRGLEGSLSAFTVCLVVFALTRCEAPWARPSRGFLLGLSIGAAFLARTDNGPLLALAVLGFVLFDPRARAIATRAPRVRLRAGAAAVGGAALISAPWLLWNAVSFGSVVQVSGLAKAANKSIFGALPELYGPDALAGWIARSSAPILFLCRYLAGEDPGLPRTTYGLLVVTAMLLAFAVPLVRRVWLEPHAPLERPLLAFAGVFLAAHLALYGFVLGNYVVWYATVPVLLATLLIGGITGGRVAALSSRASRWAWCCMLLAACVACYGNFFRHVSHAPRLNEAAAEQLLGAVRTRFPTVRTLGGFNVGALGYFSAASGGPRVVNLDGVVNNELYAAWRLGRVPAYLERDVDLIMMDAPATLRAWLSGDEWSLLMDRYPRVGQTPFYGPRQAVQQAP